MTETSSLDCTKERKVMFVLYFDHTLSNKPTISMSALSAFPLTDTVRQASSVIQQVQCQYAVEVIQSKTYSALLTSGLPGKLTTIYKNKRRVKPGIKESFSETDSEREIHKLNFNLILAAVQQ